MGTCSSFYTFSGFPVPSSGNMICPSLWASCSHKHPCTLCSYLTGRWLFFQSCHAYSHFYAFIHVVFLNLKCTFHLLSSLKFDLFSKLSSNFFFSVKPFLTCPGWIVYFFSLPESNGCYTLLLHHSLLLGTSLHICLQILRRQGSLLIYTLSHPEKIEATRGFLSSVLYFLEHIITFSFLENTYIYYY